MAPSKKSTTKKTAENENLPANRKRGRAATAAQASTTITSAKSEPVVEEKGKKSSTRGVDKEGESTATKEDIVNDLNVSSSKDDNNEEQPVKRKRGRPANKTVEGTTTTSKKEEKVIDPSVPKRGRGRPKKVTTA